MHYRSTALHLLAGGCGGTAGAILTCPLEVVKTRLQSSSLALRPLCLPEVQLQGLNGGFVRPALPSPGVLQLMRAILEKEGVRSLFRGLGPNLVGVAPSRAIYFAAYAGAKEKLNVVFVPESKKVHVLSAVCAGVTSATLTNPIWLVKTRMQLEARAREEKHSNALQCAIRVYRTEGLWGFYRGISASYAGVSETVIHFVIYEALKQQLREQQPFLPTAFALAPNSRDFFGLMAAAAISKTCASCIAYPHGEQLHPPLHHPPAGRGLAWRVTLLTSHPFVFPEVVRTRLREEGSRYRSFVQTLRLVVQEEGPLALYRGLLAQMMRQIPNTAIMMATYELIIHLATKV
ncbi:solute carrier family 25 member 33-like isoform X1 [Mauremys reevesii]|uniref:solute carrier family 25 member 33-like isoform X1 n=1 Tax=Mauremys reevesii TaxID=260615 RepID=UPI00193F1A5A|nr:solute carrier family 25 member 33-like isoform X1 [Mauremys reevesii]